MLDAYVVRPLSEILNNGRLAAEVQTAASGELRIARSGGERIALLLAGTFRPSEVRAR